MSLLPLMAGNALHSRSSRCTPRPSEMPHMTRSCWIDFGLVDLFTAATLGSSGPVPALIPSHLQFLHAGIGIYSTCCFKLVLVKLGSGILQVQHCAIYPPSLLPRFCSQSLEIVYIVGLVQHTPRSHFRFNSAQRSACFR